MSSPVISAELVDLNLESTDKDTVVRSLAERLAKAGRVTDLDGFLADVRARGSAGRWPTWWRCWPASW
jgi:mannitol/fructose-specific phosphotransferase system IIA component (Ntr-type)